MDTIAAISTATGNGGIGIIRMSGEKTFEILEKIFKPKTEQKIEDIKGYTIKYGHIIENKEKERTGIKTLRVGYNRVFGYYIEVSKGALQNLTDSDHYERKQTLANAERFITPELKKYEQIDLINDDFDYDKIIDRVSKNNIKLHDLAMDIYSSETGYTKIEEELKYGVMDYYRAYFENVVSLTIELSKLNGNPIGPFSDLDSLFNEFSNNKKAILKAIENLGTC